MKRIQLQLYDNNLSSPTLIEPDISLFSNLKFSTKLHGGFAQCAFDLQKPIERGYEWAFNRLTYRLVVYDLIGQRKLWEGRLQGSPLSINDVQINAYGYYASLLDDVYYTAFNDVPDAVIKAMLTAKCPGISSDQSNIQAMDTARNSADSENYLDKPVQTLTEYLLSLSDSTKRKFYFAVWDERIPFIFPRIDEVAERSWQANHAYNLNDLISPTINNGYKYKCTQAGTSAGFSISPTGHTDPDSAWTNPDKAYDGDIATSAALYVPVLSWSSFLELNIANLSCNNLKFYAVGFTSSGVGVSGVDVDVYYGGAWHDVYEGAFTNSIWNEQNIAKVNITAARIRFYNYHSALSRMLSLKEFMFYQSEPTWPATLGDTVADNAVVWTNDGAVIKVDWAVKVRDLKTFQLTPGFENLWNSAYALYRVSGVLTRTAVTTNSDSISKYGITRNYIIPDLGEVSLAEAEGVRDAWLSEHKDLISYNTNIVLGASVFDPTDGQEYPSSWVRAGDVVQISDIMPSSSDLSTPGRNSINTFYILETDYSLDSQSNRLTVDSENNSLEAILARNITKS